MDNDPIRVANTVIGFMGFVWLLARMALRRKEHTYAVTVFLLTLSFYVFGVAVASVELMVLEVERGPWSFVWLFANFALFVSLALTYKRRPLSKVEGD